MIVGGNALYSAVRVLSHAHNASESARARCFVFPVPLIRLAGRELDDAAATSRPREEKERAREEEKRFL